MLDEEERLEQDRQERLHRMPRPHHHRAVSVAGQPGRNDGSRAGLVIMSADKKLAHIVLQTGQLPVLRDWRAALTDYMNNAGLAAQAEHGG